MKENHVTTYNGMTVPLPQSHFTRKPASKRIRQDGTSVRGLKASIERRRLAQL